MTALKREGAPPGGEAPEKHSGLAATEYENPEYNRKPFEFQHFRSLTAYMDEVSA